jgi:GTP-binding protein
VRQAPRVAEPGLPAERFTAELRLKLICDAALLGVPNAGKSSLLRRLSNAEPKVADYPFTTLAPVLGTVEAADGRQLVVADVPGLVEGASEGVGLGHEFLAHLERASLFIHVIDCSEPGTADRFHAIETELRRYGGDLTGRPQIVFLNKSDVNPDPVFEVDDQRILTVITGSALVGTGVDELRDALFRHVSRAAPSSDDLADYLVYRPRSAARRGFRILRTDDGWAVVAADPDSLDRPVIESALRDAGARSGQLVEIGDDVFEIT